MRSRDIIWLNKSYGAWIIKNQVSSDEVQDDDEEESMRMDLKEGIIKEDERKASKLKVIRAMKKLQGWANPDVIDIIDASISRRYIMISESTFAFRVSDHPKKPGIEDHKRKWQVEFSLSIKSLSHYRVTGLV